MIPSVARHPFGKSGLLPGSYIPPSALVLAVCATGPQSRKPGALRFVFGRRAMAFAVATVALSLATWALNASDAQELKSEPGISYKNDKFPREPWSIHVIKIDRSRKDLGFYAAHA